MNNLGLYIKNTRRRRCDLKGIFPVQIFIIREWSALEVIESILGECIKSYRTYSF